MFQLFLRARAQNYLRSRQGDQDFRARSADRDAETELLERRRPPRSPLDATARCRGRVGGRREQQHARGRNAGSTDPRDDQPSDT